MADPWIATCRVRAITKSKRRWEGDTDIGEGLLIMQATDYVSYRTGIKTAIEAKGYVLEDVIDPSPLAISPAYVKHRREIDQSYWQISQAGLLLINGFHPVASDATCAEITWDRLFVPGADPLWAIIDGVNWSEAFGLLDGRNDAVCLYATPDPSAKAAAPWLVRLTADSPITALFKARSQDAHSGILCQSKWAMEEIRKHLRKFTMVWTPADQNAPIYFRFYDPRVLLDSKVALSAKNWNSFSAPFSSMIAPLSPRCLVPVVAKVDAPCDVFDDAETYQGRLMKIACGSASSPADKFAMQQDEFDAFGALQLQKSKRALARELHAAMGTFYTKEAFLTAAYAAPDLANLYGLKSKKQVHLIARCLLIMGPGFPDAYPEAGAILNDTRQLPWQRKNRLQDWLMSAMPVPSPIAPNA